MEDMDSENFFLRCEKFHIGLLSGTVLVLMLSLLIGPCNADMSAYDWNNLGTTYYNQGDYTDAINAFLNAVNIDPNLAIAWNNLGIAYQANNQYSQAQDAFQHAISINNGYDEGWSNLAYVYQYQGRNDDYNNAMKHVHPGFVRQGLVFNNFQNGNFNGGNHYNGFDKNRGPGFNNKPNPNWNDANHWQNGEHNNFNPNFPGFNR
jgi:tetratricopeptide (TPR) repeat protein